jgi:hypothetical protein
MDSTKTETRTADVILADLKQNLKEQTDIHHKYRAALRIKDWKEQQAQLEEIESDAWLAGCKEETLLMEYAAATDDPHGPQLFCNLVGIGELPHPVTEPTCTCSDCEGDEDGGLEITAWSVD